MTEARSISPGVFSRGAIEIMQRIVDNVLDLVPVADGAALELPASNGLEFAFGAGTYACLVGTLVSSEKSLSVCSLTQVATLHSDDAFVDSRADNRTAKATGIRSMICVPLRYRAQVLGVLLLGAAEESAFDADDIAVLNGVGEFVASAVEAATAMNRILTGSPEGVSETLRPGGRRLKVYEYVASIAAPGFATRIEVEKRIERVITEREFSIAFQPVVDLRTDELSGFEALARFHPGPYRPPNAWVGEAYEVGRGHELELLLVETALQSSKDVDPGLHIGVNVSPSALLEPGFCEIVERFGQGRVVVELTENEAVASHELLHGVLSRVRGCGGILALDDVGSGFSSLSRVVQLAPEIVKLDVELVRGIDVDPIRRSLSSALLTFANESGARVVAEGIEQPSELATLRELGVPLGQGYLIGRPGPLSVYLSGVDLLAPSGER